MPYALVTGASDGIGAELVKHLLDDKWNVILVARSIDKMQKITSKYPKSSYLIEQCDVTKSNEILQTCKNTLSYCNNHLQLLVNNAGATKFDMNLETCDENEWDWHLNLNLKSVFLFSKYLKSGLINCGKNGSIVNIGSICGIKAFVGLTPYCVAKAGLIQLTQCNSLELAKYGIRVNNIQPATVKTGFHKAAGFEGKSLKEYYNIANTQHPIGRHGESKDIVSMIMFLADVNKSGWITGQSFTLDGGRTLLSPAPASKSKL